MITGKKKATFFIIEGHYDESTHKLAENKLTKVWVNGYTKNYDGVILGFHRKDKNQYWTVTDIESGMRILGGSTLDECETEIINKLEDIKRVFPTSIRRQKVIEQIKKGMVEEVKPPEEIKSSSSKKKKKTTFFVLKKWGDLSSKIEANGYVGEYDGINLGFYNSKTGKEKWGVIDLESGLILFRGSTLAESEEKIPEMMDRIKEFLQSEQRRNIIDQLKD